MINLLELKVGNTYKFTYVANDKIVWKVATIESVSNKWIKTNKWFVPAQSVIMFEERG
jgi:hypothetical protein